MEKNNKKWITISYLCFIAGVALWLPNIIFEYGYGFWILTFIINPIGIVFGVLGRSKLAITLNTLMTFSFFIFMFVGSLLDANFG